MRCYVKKLMVKYEGEQKGSSSQQSKVNGERGPSKKQYKEKSSKVQKAARRINQYKERSGKKKEVARRKKT